MGKSNGVEISSCADEDGINKKLNYCAILVVLQTRGRRERVTVRIVWWMINFEVTSCLIPLILVLPMRTASTVWEESPLWILLSTWDIQIQGDSSNIKEVAFAQSNLERESNECCEISFRINVPSERLKKWLGCISHKREINIQLLKKWLGVYIPPSKIALQVN